MKVDKLLKRKYQDVKAIVAYDGIIQIISSREMDKVAPYKKILATGGAGTPHLAIDLKENKKRGKEINIVFLGKYNIEKIEKPGKWKSFGHIILSEEQAKEFARKIMEVCNGNANF